MSDRLTKVAPCGDLSAGVHIAPRALIAAIGLSLSPIAAAALAQQPARGAESHVHPEARRLVVAVRSYQPGRDIAQFGAGVVVGLDAQKVYVATALHVVRQRDELADRIWVRFEDQPGDSVRAEIVRASDDPRSLDLAFVSVPRARAPGGLAAALDRLGQSERLRTSDAVSPIGCPDEVCWGAPSPPDRVLLATPLEVVFQSTFTKRGSSGGGLFDRWWEVVGLVTRVDPPRADAIPIDFVVRQAETWDVPVSIRRPKIPRGWYGNTVRADLLFPTASPGDLIPSLKATLSHTVRRPLTVDVSYLRLAPGELNGCPPPLTEEIFSDPNVSRQELVELDSRQPCEFVINAALVGVGLDFNKGRFAAHPFVQAGVAQQEARVDEFGFFVGEAPPRYEPANRSDEQTSVIVGAGLSVDLVAIPRLIVRLTSAYWFFRDPFVPLEPLPSEFDQPEIPHLYFGLGVGFGL